MRMRLHVQNMYCIMTINRQPSLLHPNSNNVSTFSWARLEESRCSVFCKPTCASCVFQYTPKGISVLFKRIGLSTQTIARFKLIPRIRSYSLTDNLCPDCSDICLHLFFSLSLQSFWHPRGTQGADWRGSLSGYHRPAWCGAQPRFQEHRGRAEPLWRLWLLFLPQWAPWSTQPLG